MACLELPRKLSLLLNQIYYLLLFKLIPNFFKLALVNFHFRILLTLFWEGKPIWIYSHLLIGSSFFLIFQIPLPFPTLFKFFLSQLLFN